MSNPYLSIIIPVYNMEKYVERCIRSILTQRFRDYELLIIDDGSKDGSCNVVRALASGDSRIKLYEYPNGGVSVARNRGIENVKGEYVMFIDADDYISEDYLQHIMSQLNLYHADIFIWGLTKNQLNGRELQVVPSIKGLLSQKDFLKEFVKEQYDTHKGLYGYISNKLMKSEIILSYGIRFDESMKLMEDYDFFLRYYECCQSFYCFDEVGYHYVAYSTHSGKVKRNVNYIQLIDTHLKCRSLLEGNDALTILNEEYLKKAIGGLGISAFLEMKDVSRGNIKHLVEQLHNRKFAVEALRLLDTQKKSLKKWILDKNIYFIYLYLTIWNLYLNIRRR